MDNHLSNLPRHLQHRQLLFPRRQRRKKRLPLRLPLVRIISHDYSRRRQLHQLVPTPFSPPFDLVPVLHPHELTYLLQHRLKDRVQQATYTLQPPSSDDNRPSLKPS